MPMLFALGQHHALQAVARQLRPREHLFAFLDDIYVICAPDRVAEVYRVLEAKLWAHARIRVNVLDWNESGREPEGCAHTLGPRAWCGNKPPEERGVTILGTPLGHPDFVKARLEEVLVEHKVLLEKLGWLSDLQSAWLLLLLYCATARANYHTRVVPPELSKNFAEGQDDNLWGCLSGLLGLNEKESAVLRRGLAKLPFSLGGLGLRSATRLRVAAYWASWAESLAMIRARHPGVAADFSTT